MNVTGIIIIVLLSYLHIAGLLHTIVREYVFYVFYNTKNSTLRFSNVTSKTLKT